MRTRSPAARIAVVCAVAALAGCGTSLPRPAAPPPQPPMVLVESDPLLLLAERTEGGTEITEIDAGELLARAGALEESDRCEDAVPVYAEVARRFAGTPTEGEALYREGVCLETLGDWVGALHAFQRRLESAGDGPVARADLPALIHASLLAENLAMWDAAEAGYRRLLGAAPLEPADRRAATMRLAAVLAAEGDLAAAEPLMREVVAETGRLLEAGEIPHPAPAAEAHYRLGLMSADSMRSLPLDAAETRAARAQLAAKAARFSEAFEEFAAAVRNGSPYWAVVAGYEVGRMYLDVYDAVVGAPRPPEVGPEAVEAYEALVRARTRVLLANALSAWEENLVRAERAGLRCPAVDATAEGLDRARAVVEALESGRTGIDDEAARYLESIGESDALASFTGSPDETPPAAPVSPPEAAQENP